MTDQDKAQSIERANSYRQMMESWAWKDFQTVMTALKTEARTGMDALDVDNITVARTAEYLGYIKAFNKIENELGYILAGTL